MFQLPLDWSRMRTVLCLGAHCDDIEIGCGGTLMRLKDLAPGVQFHWCVFSGDDVREAETRAAAAALLGSDGAVHVEVARFRNSYFPYVGGEIKEFVESLRKRVVPDLIFTHWLADRHQDHRLIAELTWNAFRNHLILEYEIPKFEGDLGQPNVLSPLSPEHVERKLDVLERCFPSQRSRPWFRREVFHGYLALRGVECNAASGFAEGFHGRKLVL